MRRYWLPKESDRGDVVEVLGNSYKHIIQVCRQKVGCRFEVLFGDGKAHLVELVKVYQRKAIGKKIEIREISPPCSPYIHLCLSLPKFSTLERVIEKMVELGVSALHPFVSDLSYFKNPDRISEKRVQRWQTLIQSATQQTGRGDLMSLQPVGYIKDIVEVIKSSSLRKGVFLYEGQGEMSLSETLEGKGFSTNFKEIWIIIGSEGGFSQKEVVWLRACGLAPVTLGEQILRVETACVAICSILKYLCENSFQKGRHYER